MNGRYIGSTVQRCHSDTLNIPSADTQSKGVWEELAELQGPELQRLARALPVTVLRSRAHNHRVPECIPEMEAVGTEIQGGNPQLMKCNLHLQQLGIKTQSKSAVEGAVNGMSWVHQVSGFPPISESPFVHATLAGGREFAKPRVKKEPITATLRSQLW